MRRLTPNSHSDLRAWFPQANGEALLAQGKVTAAFGFGDVASAFTLSVADHPPSPDQSLANRAALSPHPGLDSLALSIPSRAFNSHSSVVGPRFSTTDF